MRLLVIWWIAAFAFAGPNRQKIVEGIFLDPEPDEMMEEAEPAVPTTLSVMAATPLLNENAFEQKFSTWMPQLLIGFPVSGFYLETGIRASISRLNFGTEGSDFIHYFFDIPLKMMLTMAASEKTQIGLILGLIVRTFEYDTRTTADGGWVRTYSSSNLLGEAGAFFRFAMGKAVHFRIDVTTAQLGAGLEFWI